MAFTCDYEDPDESFGNARQRFDASKVFSSDKANSCAMKLMIIVMKVVLTGIVVSKYPEGV